MTYNGLLLPSITRTNLGVTSDGRDNATKTLVEFNSEVVICSDSPDVLIDGALSVNFPQHMRFPQIMQVLFGGTTIRRAAEVWRHRCLYVKFVEMFYSLMVAECSVDEAVAAIRASFPQLHLSNEHLVQLTKSFDEFRLMTPSEVRAVVPGPPTPDGCVANDVNDFTKESLGRVIDHATSRPYMLAKQNINGTISIATAALPNEPVIDALPYLLGPFSQSTFLAGTAVTAMGYEARAFTYLKLPARHFAATFLNNAPSQQLVEDAFQFVARLGQSVAGAKRLELSNATTVAADSPVNYNQRYVFHKDVALSARVDEACGAILDPALFLLVSILGPTPRVLWQWYLAVLSANAGAIPMPATYNSFMNWQRQPLLAPTVELSSAIPWALPRITNVLAKGFVEGRFAGYRSALPQLMVPNLDNLDNLITFYRAFVLSFINLPNNRKVLGRVDLELRVNYLRLGASVVYALLQTYEGQQLFGAAAARFDPINDLLSSDSTITSLVPSALVAVYEPSKRQLDPHVYQLEISNLRELYARWTLVGKKMRENLQWGFDALQSLETYRYAKFPTYWAGLNFGGDSLRNAHQAALIATAALPNFLAEEIDEGSDDDVECVPEAIEESDHNAYTCMCPLYLQAAVETAHLTPAGSKMLAVRTFLPSTELLYRHVPALSRTANYLRPHLFALLTDATEWTVGQRNWSVLNITFSTFEPSVSYKFGLEGPEAYPHAPGSKNIYVDDLTRFTADEAEAMIFLEVQYATPLGAELTKLQYQGKNIPITDEALTGFGRLLGQLDLEDAAKWLGTLRDRLVEFEKNQGRDATRWYQGKPACSQPILVSVTSATDAISVSRLEALSVKDRRVFACAEKRPIPFKSALLQVGLPAVAQITELTWYNLASLIMYPSTFVMPLVYGRNKHGCDDNLAPLQALVELRASLGVREFINYCDDRLRLAFGCTFRISSPDLLGSISPAASQLSPAHYVIPMVDQSGELWLPVLWHCPVSHAVQPVDVETFHTRACAGWPSTGASGLFPYARGPHVAKSATHPWQVTMYDPAYQDGIPEIARSEVGAVMVPWQSGPAEMRVRALLPGLSINDAAVAASLSRMNPAAPQFVTDPHHCYPRQQLPGGAFLPLRPGLNAPARQLTLARSVGPTLNPTTPAEHQTAFQHFSALNDLRLTTERYFSKLTQPTQLVGPHGGAVVWLQAPAATSVRGHFCGVWCAGALSQLTNADINSLLLTGGIPPSRGLGTDPLVTDEPDAITAASALLTLVRRNSLTEIVATKPASVVGAKFVTGVIDMVARPLLSGIAAMATASNPFVNGMEHYQFLEPLRGAHVAGMSEDLTNQTISSAPAEPVKSAQPERTAP